MSVVPCRGTRKPEGLNPGSLALLGLSAKSEGTVKLYFSNNKFLVCKDVYVVPNFGKNLLSVA